MPAKKEKLQTGEDLNQLETIFLMQDASNTKSDVTVTLNGVNYQLQRGKPVQVPKFIKLVLDHSYRQQMAASELSSRLCGSFSDKMRQIEG